MLSCTIYPCSTAKQRQRLQRVESALDLRKSQVPIHLVQARIQELIARERKLAGLQLQPVTVGEKQQLMVYDNGSLKMLIQSADQ